jgi:hypothetical protein
MGVWKRCSKCGGKIETFTVIDSAGKGSGKTDSHREGRRCTSSTCHFFEVVSTNNVVETEKSSRSKR